MGDDSPGLGEQPRAWEEAMTSAPPSSLPPPPWDLSSRYPLRTYRFHLNDIVGWSKSRVLTQLGPPDETRAGDVWRDNPTARDVLVRTPHGTVIRAPVFGPAPRQIPPLQAYETWYYHNVQRMTWILYLTRSSRVPILRRLRPRVVVEVHEYSTGAIF